MQEHTENLLMFLAVAMLWVHWSTARVSLRKYFIPGCVGRGLDLDLRIRPAAPAPAASGPKLGPRGWAQAGPKWVGPLGIEVEKQCFQTVRKITGRKFP